MSTEHENNVIHESEPESESEHESNSKEDVKESEKKTTNTPIPGPDVNILDNVLKSLFKGFNNSASSTPNNDDTDSVYEDLELDLYLLDEKGNNLCDHLQNVDTTLNKINNSLQECIAIYKNTQ
jgi:hypothetical protein